MGSARVHASFLVMVAFGLASASLVANDKVLQAKPRKLARIDFVGNRFFEADALQRALRLHFQEVTEEGVIVTLDNEQGVVQIVFRLKPRPRK